MGMSAAVLAHHHSSSLDKMDLVADAIKSMSAQHKTGIYRPKRSGWPVLLSTLQAEHPLAFEGLTTSKLK